MSTVSGITPMMLPLLVGRTRAYFAPVNRITGTPAVFDPTAYSSGSLGAPWVDLGWVDEFTRKAESKIAGAETGTPAVARMQVRESLGALVSFRFLSWSKLSMALATSSQHMNLLAPARSAAATATALAAGSTAATLYLPANSQFSLQAGSLVVVDDDYAGQVGFVGAGAAGGWVQGAASVQNDLNYVRRVSFNVGRVVRSGQDGGAQLASPLLACAPTATMKVQQVVGFVDREGGSFFQEWSAVFVAEGTQGERVCYYYPRLQPCQGASEAAIAVAAPIEMILLKASFRALPVNDGSDGATVLCYRSFLPSTQSYI